MNEIFNLQRKVSIDKEDLREFISSLDRQVLEASGKTFSLALVSDSRMRQLNQLFRGKETTTDVLSFPHVPDEFDPNKDNLGDIVISAEQAERQAAENGLDLETELKQLILHGLLHLCGYDHETDAGEMDARELEVRIALSVDQ